MKLNWFRDGDRLPLVEVGVGNRTAFEERPEPTFDFNLSDQEALEGVHSEGVYVRVETIMSQPAITVAHERSASEALQLLEEHAIRHLLVVDGSQRLLGIVSERDLLGYLAEELEQVEVTELMIEPVLAAAPEARLHEAARVLWERRFSCLPVVDPAGRPLGVVTVSDVLRFVLERPWMQLYS